MFSLISILAPSVFGIKIIDYFKNNLNLKQIFYYYAILLTFSNVGANIITNILFNINDNIFSLLNTDSIFFSKYTITSLIVTIIITIIYLIIDKNIKFKIEVEHAKKTKKNKHRKNN